MRAIIAHSTMKPLEKLLAWTGEADWASPLLTRILPLARKNTSTSSIPSLAIPRIVFPNIKTSCMALLR